MATVEVWEAWADPRPDLYADSSLWARLLRAAYALDSDDPDGLFWALHGFRCYGASLRLGEHTAILGPGEIDPADYAAWKRRYLEPHREALVCLLARLADETAQQAMA
jgi:hypothetical protein